MSKKDRLNKSISLYEDFTGHEARYIDEILVKELPDVAVKIGRCVGIAYECIRDGQREQYFHEFKKGSAPILAASSDGKQLILIGGKFEFTNAGIVDR